MAASRVSKKSPLEAAPRLRVPGVSDEELAPALGLYQILDPSGKVMLPDRELPRLAPAQLLEMYRATVMIRTMDERLLALQRQGRIGFYGEARGQEAAVIGSAYALEPEDYVVPALREAGAAILRGLPLRAYVAQIFGNANDIAHGRQMPCHPGSRASRYVTMSSCVATQLPHAQGMAWAARIRGHKIVVMGYLGDGATSEEDFHVAMNFAGVYHVPVVFFCQNNQWAISVPVARQTASETLAVKAIAYGMPGVRVDGNDILAVYKVAKEAVERARVGGGPTFIEALTYRMGAHSSSDDPSRYRDESITEEWKARDPILRFRAYLFEHGLIDQAADQRIREQVAAEVRDAIAAEEAVGPPRLGTLVEDVYADVPWNLKEQLAELERSRSRE
jgi:pyruvate dehydrogenase E1 component alpha subunit/2-oxoisovalerate dehydrogenase E1 component alpha subunit